MRTLPGEFTVEQLMSLHDLSTEAGRRTAARVIVQRAALYRTCYA